MKRGIELRLATGFVLFLLFDIFFLVCILFSIKLSDKAFAIASAIICVLSFSGGLILNKNYDPDDDSYDKYFLIVDVLLGCACIKLLVFVAKALRI